MGLADRAKQRAGIPVQKSPGSSAGATMTRPSSESSEVRVMQRLMGDLEKNLSIPQNLSKIVNSLYKYHFNEKIDGNYIANLAKGFGATSAGGVSGSYDGLWGKNTKASLQNIKNFVNQTKIPDVLIQVGQGQSPYKEMSSDKIAEMAKSNILNLSRIFKAIGLSAPQYVKGKVQEGAGYPVDWISQTLTAEQANSTTPWPKYIGNIPVTYGDISSFIKFFNFIQVLEYTECKPLQLKKAQEKQELIKKVAKTILENTIIKSAQDALDIVNPWENKPQTPEGQGICLNVIDDFIIWFRRRSSMVYGQLVKTIQEAKPHPLPSRKGSPVTAADIKAAEAYKNTIAQLAQFWVKIRPMVISELKKRKLEQYPLVTEDVLMNVQSSGGEAAFQRVGPGGYTIPAEKGYNLNPLKGPIKNYMRLELEVDQYNPDSNLVQKLRELSQNRQLPNISIDRWSKRSWIDIAIRDVAGESRSERMRGFFHYANALLDLLQSLLRKWESEFGEKVGDRVSRQQDYLLGKWEAVIRSQIAAFHRNSAQAVSKAEELEGKKQNIPKTPKSERVVVIPRESVYKPKTKEERKQEIQQAKHEARLRRIRNQ
jgi:hypothetical protein